MSGIGGNSKGQLRSLVERVERLEEEIKGLNGDKKEVYAEAKGAGFDTKIIKRVVALRRLDSSERMEQDSLLDIYLQALGMATSGSREDDGRNEEEF